MSYEYNKKLVKNAQNLRKNMTPEEKHLWYDFLKKLPITVHRQKNIGNYIVDFYVSKPRMVIELDGAGHFEEKGEIADAARTKFLNEFGITVLRFTNQEINKHFYDVCCEIADKLSININIDELLSED